MRILFALPYGPTLTRVRSRMLLAELAARHDITLLGLAWGPDDREALLAVEREGAVVHVVPHRRAAQARALAGDPGRPLQQIIATSRQFAQQARRLIAEAAAMGAPFDAIHVEHFRGASAIDFSRPLGVRTVFDAVDCIGELARLTAEHGAGRLVRVIARHEHHRTRRAEASFVRAADVTTVVAERDRQALASVASECDIHVIPNGVSTLPRPTTLTESPIAIFTGKLSYHANQAAARALLVDIWPRVRRALPDARLVIAGAETPEFVRSVSGRDGIAVIDNPPAMLPLIAQARVALAPMIYSVGIQNKVLEAMACGVPVVATSTACAGLLPEAARCVSAADDPVEFAAHIVRLLSDESAARALGVSGYAYVSLRHSWNAAATMFEYLYAAGGSVRAAA